MKVQIDSLEFDSDYFYIQTNSIVEKIIFNNRTFYTKLQKHPMPINSILLKQHQEEKISLSIPLIEKDFINYIAIQYKEDDWQVFYALLKHLFKSLNIKKYQAYYNKKEKLFQLFIFRRSTLKNAYKEVEEIKYILEFKFKKSYKIYPNKNLPKNFNIITLPIEKT